jgi:hypothetical protein
MVRAECTRVHRRPFAAGLAAMRRRWPCSGARSHAALWVAHAGREERHVQQIAGGPRRDWQGGSKCYLWRATVLTGGERSGATRSAREERMRTPRRRRRADARDG